MHTNSQEPNSYLCAHSWPQPLLPDLVPNAVCVFTTGPCHYTGTCSWSAQPRTYPPLTPATTSACPGPQPLDLEVLLRNPRILTVYEDPCSTHQGPWRCQWCCFCDLREWVTTPPLNTADTHLTLLLVPCTVRPGSIACFSVPLPAGEDFSFWSQSITSRRETTFSNALTPIQYYRDHEE